MSDAAGARTIEDTLAGAFVPDLLDTLNDYDDETPPTRAEFNALIQTIRRLVSATNGAISLGDGKQSSRTGNLNAQNIQINIVDTATVLEVPHGLGRKPVGYLWYVQRYTARSGGAAPILVPCGSDGNVSLGGGDNAVDNVPTAWDNRMVFFTAEGDAAWLPALYRVILF